MDLYQIEPQIKSYQVANQANENLELNAPNLRKPPNSKQSPGFLSKQKSSKKSA